MYYNIYIYVFKDYYPDIKRYKLNLFLNQSKKKKKELDLFFGFVNKYYILCNILYYSYFLLLSRPQKINNVINPIIYKNISWIKIS